MTLGELVKAHDASQTALAKMAEQALSELAALRERVAKLEQEVAMPATETPAA